MEALNGLSLEHIKDFDFPSHSCINRIMRDLRAIYEEPPPGILVIQDEEKVNVLYALITGPVQSPYEGGFFYFIIKCPNDYPIKPPGVKFMTTDAGKIRFNPNLYKCGKVCLSILGTWVGPPWSPAQTLSSTLISIQSLLCEDPYRNEPGYEKDPFGEPRGHFDFKAILERLRKLHKVVSEQLKIEEYSSDDELIINDFEETD